MTERLARGLALGVLALGIALRFAQLGADPYYYEWNGYLTDEGRWIAHARSLVLFGEIRSVGSLIHLIVAPLYQALSYVVFLVAGVTLWSTRLISAVSGSLLLVTVFVVLRRACRPEALVLALAMLAVEMDMVVLSRIAIPEMAAMSLTLLAFVLLVGEPIRSSRMFAAGLLMAAALGIKATVLPVMAIFVVIQLFRPVGEGGPSRAKALAAFTLGFLVLVAALAGALVAVGVGMGPSTIRSLGVIRGFFRPADLYGILATPFEDTLAPVLSVWTLAAWLGLLGWLAGSRGGALSPGEARLLHASTLWAGLFAAAMLLFEYFPSRYKIHLFVPLALVAAVGITAFQREGGPPTLGARLSGLGTWARVGTAVLLVLPTGVLLAATALTACARLRVDPLRIRTRYAVLVLAVLLVSALAVRRLRDGRPVDAFVWFPLVWTGAWMVAERIGGVRVVLWPSSTDEGAADRWLLLAVATAGTVAATYAGRRARVIGGPALVTAALLYVVLGLVRLAPGYLEPHYTMHAASRDLAGLLGDSSGRIAASGGEALFSDNRLRYRSLMGRRWPATPPEVLILASAFDDPEDRLDREYRLIRQYTIYVSPEFILGESSWNADGGEFRRTHVRVYRRAG